MSSFGWPKKSAIRKMKLRPRIWAKERYPPSYFVTLLTKRTTNELFPPKDKPPQATVNYGILRFGKYWIQKIEWIRMRLKQTFITRTTQIISVKRPWKTFANVTQGFAQMNTEQSYTHRIKSNLVTLDLLLYTYDLWASWKRKGTR